jgi:hypothetical protein
MLPPSPSAPFKITIGGVPLPDLVMQDLQEVVVTTGLNIPGMFSIRLNAKNEPETGVAPGKMFTYLDPTPMFAVAMPVTIMSVNAQESPLPGIPALIMVGEITAVEAEFDSEGTASVTIRGFDRSHRLTRGKKTMTFLAQSDNLIVQTVTATATVPCTAMPTTSPPREYVLQNNQSDWDFLRDIAERNGYDLVVDPLGPPPGVLKFQPQGVPVPGLPEILTWGDNLTSFRPGITSAFQVATATVQGVDPSTGSKAPVVGPGLAPPPIVPAGVLPQLALSRTAFGVTKETVVDRPTWGLTPPVPAMLGATAMATAKAIRRSGEFLQAEGECMGNPGVRAGSQVMVMGVGTTFSGPYLISSATHRYTPEAGYTTEFLVTGPRPDTLSHLLKDQGGAAGNGRIYGVVVGIVTNNSDPSQLGRVKVMLPHLGASPPAESNWCRMISFGGGGLPGMGSGIYYIPEVGDEVLVAFEHGDPNYPYVLGTLWNQIAMPPPPTGGAFLMGPKVARRVIRSRSGHEITLNDAPGKESISIVDKTMLNKFEIDSTKQSLTISVMGDVVIDCLNFKVKSKANVEIEALAKASLKGTAAFSAESSGILKIKAATMLGLEGSAVKVNANTLLQLQGMTTKIN